VDENRAGQPLAGGVGIEHTKPASFGRADRITDADSSRTRWLSACQRGGSVSIQLGTAAPLL
jgi:hypothetical protein